MHSDHFHEVSSQPTYPDLYCWCVRSQCNHDLWPFELNVFSSVIGRHVITENVWEAAENLFSAIPTPSTKIMMYFFYLQKARYIVCAWHVYTELQQKLYHVPHVNVTVGLHHSFFLLLCFLCFYCYYVFIDVRLSHLNKDYLLTYLQYSSFSSVPISSHSHRNPVVSDLLTPSLYATVL